MSLQPPLTVITSNVRWDNPDDGAHRWEFRRAPLLNLLRSQSPDVLGFQEPYRHQLEYLRLGLPEYDAVGVGRNDGDADGEFCAILFRRERFTATDSGTFWLAEDPEKPGSIAWGSRHPRICTWVNLVETSTHTSFTVYNVHLDHESQTARDNGVALLLDRIRLRTAPGPVLVLGDFNAPPDNPAVLKMQENTSLQSAWGEKPEGTFHGFTGDAPDGPIDYIFHSPEWQVQSIQTLRGNGARPYPSDHFPVAIVLAASLNQP